MSVYLFLFYFCQYFCKWPMVVFVLYFHGLTFSTNFLFESYVQYFPCIVYWLCMLLGMYWNVNVAMHWRTVWVLPLGILGYPSICFPEASQVIITGNNRKTILQEILLQLFYLSQKCTFSGAYSKSSIHKTRYLGFFCIFQLAHCEISFPLPYKLVCGRHSFGTRQ